MLHIDYHRNTYLPAAAYEPENAESQNQGYNYVYGKIAPLQRITLSYTLTLKSFSLYASK